MKLEFVTKLYADAVLSGERALESVPEMLREQVSTIIKERKDND